MPQMPRATRVGPRDGDENALLATVREGVPPGRARSRTSYGGRVGRTDARRSAVGVAGRRRRAQRARGRPGRAGPAASASGDAAALPPPASQLASRRPARPGRPAAPAAPARVSGARLNVECANSAHERFAPGTARAEHAEPTPHGPAASASVSQLQALSRAEASQRIVAGHVLSTRPDARAAGLSVTDWQQEPSPAEPAAAPVTAPGPAAPAPAPAWEAEASADRRSRWGPR